MTFAHPAWLWGLLGLLVPIAIHLWSRRKVRVIKVGSIQWLQETTSRKSNRIQLHEYALLALRCLILLLVVLLLSGPQLRNPVDASPVTFLVDPLLAESTRVKAAREQNPEAEWRWFSPEFPVYDASDEAERKKEVPNYWQLSRDMESLPTDSIVVYTQSRLSGVRGKRPELMKPVQFIVLPDESSLSQLLQARRTNRSIEALTLTTDANGLAFAKSSLRDSRPTGEQSDKSSLRDLPADEVGSRPTGEQSDKSSLRDLPAEEVGSRPAGGQSDTSSLEDLPQSNAQGSGTLVALQPLQEPYSISGDSLIKRSASNTEKVAIKNTLPIRLQMYRDEAQEQEARLLKAALIAIEKYTQRPIAVQIKRPNDFSQPDREDPIIWLSDQEPPAMEGKLLVYRQDSLSNSWIEKAAHPNLSYLVQKLSLKNSLEYHLSESLLNWLLEDHELKQRIAALDRRQMDERLLQPRLTTGALDQKFKEKDLALPFWLLLIVALGGERILSFIRKQ
ncbi:BatA domain-containing protein [Croceiramulus getboli]|nr:BatA domain-containing protein [Flavobacteriaceae bacterium YJPT1-3]